MHGIESEVNSDIAFLDRSALYMPDEIPNPRRARYEKKSSWSSQRDKKILIILNRGCVNSSHLLVTATVLSFIQPQNFNFA